MLANLIENLLLLLLLHLSLDHSIDCHHFPFTREAVVDYKLVVFLNWSLVRFKFINLIVTESFLLEYIISLAEGPFAYTNDAKSSSTSRLLIPRIY